MSLIVEAGCCLCALSCGGVGGKQLPIERFGAALNTAQCDFESRCGEPFAREVAFCEALFAPQFTSSSFGTVGATGAAVEAGKVKYDATLGQTCIDQVRS